MQKKTNINTRTKALSGLKLLCCKNKNNNNIFLYNRSCRENSTPFLYIKKNRIKKKQKKNNFEMHSIAFQAKKNYFKTSTNQLRIIKIIFAREAKPFIRNRKNI